VKKTAIIHSLIDELQLDCLAITEPSEDLLIVCIDEGDVYNVVVGGKKDMWT